MPRLPPQWNTVAQTAWEDNRRNDAIQTLVGEINASGPEKPEAAVLQLAYYLFLIGDYRSAATVLETRLTSTTNPAITLNLAVCHLRLRRFADAVAMAQRTLARQPDNIVAHDTLASACFGLGDLAAARQAGTQALQLKAATARPAASDWRLPAGSPAAWADLPGKSPVIAFSLWGSQPRYLRGGLRNLLLAADLYPGWRLRFYHDATVPAEFIALIHELDGETIQQPDGQSLRQKLCWRFQVANDPTVGRFLVRDIDSVFSLREANAVAEWLASDRWFHVIRDWWTHTDLILAGLWGGIAGVLPELSAMLAEYDSQRMETPNVDQWFLGERVWGYLQHSCLIHDRCFDQPGSRRLPTPGDDRHIGQNEAVLALQERLLRPWIERHPCLGELPPAS
jgi:tetratricopeptide (TPR) repeat protein